MKSKVCQVNPVVYIILQNNLKRRSDGICAREKKRMLKAMYIPVESIPVESVIQVTNKVTEHYPPIRTRRGQWMKGKVNWC